MTQPDLLKNDAPLKWSAGRGTDVWKLFCACSAGDLEAVQCLLSANPSLVRSHYAYRKPLYFAVRENRISVAAFLLERDPDPIGLAVNDSLFDICRDRGHAQMLTLLETQLSERHGISSRGEPVAAAIRERNSPKMARLLDDAPDLLHVGDLRSNLPLHWAVMTRQLELIDELLGRGADIDARRSDGARAIHLTNGDYHYRGWRDVPRDWPMGPAAVLDHLISRGAKIDLGMACAMGDFVRAVNLLDATPSLVNRLSDYKSGYPGGGAPIKNAAAGGHIHIVKLLLERGADPNVPEEGIAPSGHALYSAVANGHYEIAKLLLEHGAHPNAEVESSADALSRAISNNDQRMIDLLCEHGAARAVHLLGYYNDLRTAASLFAANPALADDAEALANAASEGHEGFVRLMLRYRPELPRRLQFPGWAVGARNRGLNELLFQHGMNPSAADWLGITPLHHLAHNGDMEKAALFLDHGANIHARDEDICSTPLAWAAKGGQTAMVDFLLQRGAHPNHADDPPWATALSWATRRGHRETAELLKGRGAL